jgi:cell division protein FtsI/penicillin-binding protein 2
MERVYGGMAQRLKVTEVLARPLEPSADGSLVPFQATLTLDGLGDVSWATTLKITRTEAGLSKVHFTAKAVHPDLAVGQRLDLAASDEGRADVLDREGRSLARNKDLVANLVGRFDPRTGTASGLQRVLADRLGGTGKRALAVVDAGSGEVVDVVKEFPPLGAKPEGVRTTIDLDVQRAAAKALAGAPARAALVAIDVPTGEVRALANRPYTGIPPATSGTYPPGSTFKIVTALAALREGRTPRSTVSCPTTTTAYGKVFRNHEKAPNRDMTLTEAFADSCNTAFIGLARDLPEGGLAGAAEDLGFNAVQDPLPVASFGGSYPAPKDGAELAASAIGQGRVQASPLQMASVAAAIASGTWTQPHVLECPDCTRTPIPEAPALRPMMRAVVTSGTGTAAAGVPGGPVRAKTGTAEFGTGTIRNHAWFVGWQGDVAFAVFVERGASGGETAAPIAARFLRTLAAS